MVANPPYSNPSDKAASNAYRRLYSSCHRRYSFTVPFMERIFRLAIRGNSTSAGYTGQITANGFMKRLFGKKLVEEFLTSCDLTCVVDMKGVVFGNAGFGGTSTTVIFGRNRISVASKVRAVTCLRGEPSTIDDPRQGLVWQSILRNVDKPDGKDEFSSSSDFAREMFSSHPWALADNATVNLKTQLDEEAAEKLHDVINDIGLTCITKADEVFAQPLQFFRRKGVEGCQLRAFGIGESVRDWVRAEYEWVIFPYDEDVKTIQLSDFQRIADFFWLFRAEMGNRKVFGGHTYFQSGKPWYEYGQIPIERFKIVRSIAFAFMGTLNHFCFDRGGTVFKQTAPVIKLDHDATDEQHFHLLSILNSSIVCFWLKQICHNHGAGGGTRVRSGRSPLGDDNWESLYEYDTSKLKQLPIVDLGGCDYGKAIVELATVVGRKVFAVARERLAQIGNEQTSSSEKMIRLQEDLDWHCYFCYGLATDDLTYPAELSLGIELGQRAFEIVLARKMACGEVASTWFERHRSTPITEIPENWPEDYKQLVQKRIEVIESNPQIALIEQPEYKRRWNTEPWEDQVQAALKSWMLDRLESYFDFDGRMKDSSGGILPPTEQSSGGVQPLTEAEGEDANGGKMPPLQDDENGGWKPPLREIALYSVCLLYTSPSPRDRQKSRMPSSA